MHTDNKPKVGIFYIATGNYTLFWPGFKDSADKLLLPDADKHYFLFTDSIKEPAQDTTTIRINHQPWPGIVLSRFDIILQAYDLWKDMDYVLYVNGNSVIINEILFSDVFSDKYPLTACAHACGGVFCAISDRSFEKNTESTAYVHGANIYVQSGMQGGRTESIKEAYETMRDNVNKDAARGITAVWHDESHWNRYVIDHQDKVKYLGWPTMSTVRHPYAKVLLLEKDHFFNVREFKNA